MAHIWLIGTDHRASDVPLRERLAFQEADIRRLLPLIRQAGMDEAVVLSTCNRMEIYGVSPDPDAPQRVAALIEQERGLRLEPRAGKEAVRHLFEVSAGVASMILGEGQILAQIRQALEVARGEQSAGPVLNGLFEDAISAGKRVRSETTLGSGVVSVGSAAVRHAKQFRDGLDQASILVMGAGQMGELTLKHLRSQGACDVSVTNRDEARGRQVADKHGARWLPMAAARAVRGGFDVVFVCTGAAAPLVDPTMIGPWLAGRHQPLLLVDLAMPRNVAPELRMDSRVALVDLDDLKATVRNHHDVRLAALPQVKRILDEAEAGFWTWLDARAVSTPLYAWANAVCEDELLRNLAKLGLDEEQRQGVLAVTRGVAHKLLHKPVAAIWQEPDDAKRRAKASQVAMLFGL